MKISGTTTICGLIGDPVEHSMSPAMQNAAFAHLGLDFAYVPFRVKAHDVGAAIAALKALNMRGLNVTIPHKRAVIRYLDRVDAVAAKIGAVNTIVNENGVLVGYNTDASGFMQTLLEKGVSVVGKRVLVIGAGGAARGIAFALADKKAKVTVLNRTPERAMDLASELSKEFGVVVRGDGLSEDVLPKAIEGSDVVVNTTSVGMGDSSEETPVPARLLGRGLTVYDIVYNPIKTRLLLEAERVGCEVIGGAEMLAWQGALAFELWTGKKAPIELMKREVIRHLRHED